MAQRQLLTRINLDDLVEAFGWTQRPLASAMLRWAFAGTARKFAHQMIALDTLVGRHGELAAPARLFLQKHYVRELTVAGRVPDGPVLFLANHPGMADTLSLFAAIGRSDLKVIAQARPFLSALNNTAKHLVFTEENLGRRVIAAHEMAAHLRAGGAALTFPAGHIEPDPALDRDAVRSLRTWADSARCILHLAPETRVVPVTVSGVVWPKATTHWLTRRRDAAREREKLSAALQLIAMVAGGVRPTHATVRFGETLAPSPFLRDQVLASMRHMIEQAHAGDAGKTTDLGATGAESFA